MRVKAKGTERKGRKKKQIEDENKGERSEEKGEFDDLILVFGEACFFNLPLGVSDVLSRAYF